MTKDTSDIKKNETVTKKDTPDVKAENGVGAGAGSCDISSPLTVSASPHIFGSTDTRGIMLDVLLALLPTTVLSIALFRLSAALLIAVCVAFSVLGEWAFQKICRRANTVGDLSAVVTGLLLALNLPASVTLWQAALGSLIAVIVVKGLFGGIGHNFANPAITARIVMLIAFSATVTAKCFPVLPSFVGNSVDLVTGATPLAILKSGTTAGLPSIPEMLFGLRGGSIGEGHIIALLIGFVYLLVRRVITWHTPVAFIGTVFLVMWIAGGSPVFALYEILSGGLVLGAVFMATDYTTTPTTHLGHFIFGVGCGLVTCVIRLFSNSYPEGVSFSILLMNILTPYIDRFTLRRPFGGIRK